MKTSLLALPVLAGAFAIEDPSTLLDRRQSLANFFGAGTSQKPAAVENLKPQFDERAVRERLLYGPYKLQPINGTHAPGPLKTDPTSDAFFGTLSGVCKDCVVLGAQAEVAFEDGTIADLAGGVYSHHIMITTIGKTQVQNPVSVDCNGRTADGFGGSPSGIDPNIIKAVGSLIEATGLDKAVASLLEPFQASPFIVNGGDGSMVEFAVKRNSSIKSGYYVPKQDDSMLLTMEIVNYDDFPKDIYLSLDYEYLPSRPLGYLDASMGAINFEACSSPIFHPPTDKAVSLKSPEWNITNDGYLLDIIPHLHDGGTGIELYKNGDLICSPNAIYGNDGVSHADIDGERWETITSYERCTDALPIKKGDTLSMVANYDVPKHRLRPNNMNHGMGSEGMAMTFFQFVKEVKY